MVVDGAVAQQHPKPNKQMSEPIIDQFYLYSVRLLR